MASGRERDRCFRVATGPDDVGGEWIARRVDHGLTLGEIKGVIAFREQGSPPCSHVLELIEGRATDLDRRIAELGNLRDDLRALADRG